MTDGTKGQRGDAIARTGPRVPFWKYVRRGDLARDAGRWAEAVGFYRKHLTFRRRDVGIWVQLGNCSKEAGDFDGALAAYDTALKLNDHNADAHLQKGHLLKLMGRNSQAVSAYRRSLDIAARRNPAFSELLALGAPTDHEAAPRSAAATIYIDVTDVVDYLQANLSLSGIQRVVANLIDYGQDFARDQDCAVRIVVPDYQAMTISTISTGLMKSLVDTLATEPSRATVDRALQALQESQRPVTLGPHDTLLIAGAFWIYHRYDLLNQLRQQGTRVVVFIHDLIQVTNPEFVEPKATTVFRRSFVDVLSVSSYIFTNSRFVAKEVESYLSARLNFRVPVLPMTLATELGEVRGPAELIGHDIRQIVRDDYVLSVGTIEIRKNHLYLIRIWEELIVRNAPWIPNLIFVGKWGWEIDDLHDHLRHSDYLGGRLFIFNGISDAELAYLYQHCQMTLYPSFAEGWGLPVGESLGYGKPCIASDRTSIPEVGGDYCRYVDPFDAADGFRVVAEVLADRPALQAWAARIKREFKPKSWQSFAYEVFGHIRDFAADPALDRPGNNCVIETGDILYVGDNALDHLDATGRRLVTGRMSRTIGWHPIGKWGCWAARRRAELVFRTRLAPGTELVVYLFLRTPDDDLGADCTILCGPATTRLEALGPTPQWCTARGVVSAEGDLRISLVSGRGFMHAEMEERFVGLIAVAVAPLHDRAGQETVLEQIVPGGLTRPALAA